MDADRPTLRALLWCSTTALQHLTRTIAIACVLCLVVKHHSSAELINTTVTEYQSQPTQSHSRPGHGKTMHAALID